MLCNHIRIVAFRQTVLSVTVLIFCCMAVSTAIAQSDKPQDHSKWILSDHSSYAANNNLTLARVKLGEMLFFDPRLSGTGKMSCASCHAPELGWSDGKAKTIGKNGKVLGRASPTITNTVYNNIFMWDGRSASLIDQATGPLDSEDEMDMDTKVLVKNLQDIKGYKNAFEKAYPGEGINRNTIARAIAAFESTIVCNDSPFDRYVAGEKSAFSKEQVHGFEIFTNPDKGNCSACHQKPNFTDDGFHNIGLASFGDDNHDIGRYKIKPIRLMDGAFKTPTLRDIASTAPYFHDGSATTLEMVVEHYIEGGVVKTNLSPEMEELKLSKAEQKDLISFLKGLSCEMKKYTPPKLPSDKS